MLASLRHVTSSGGAGNEGPLSHAAFTQRRDTMTEFRKEHDSLGEVNVPADKLWGAQTQRSLDHFSIGDDLMPRELIPAYAIIKKAGALVNNKAGRLGQPQLDLIIRVCDEILEG